MVTAGDFKNGLTIQFENNIYQIIEFQHVKPGKGAAFVRCKLKNIKMMENYSISWITKHLIRSH